MNLLFYFTMSLILYAIFLCRIRRLEARYQSCGPVYWHGVPPKMAVLFCIMSHTTLFEVDSRKAAVLTGSCEIQFCFRGSRGITKENKPERQKCKRRKGHRSWCLCRESRGGNFGCRRFSVDFSEFSNSISFQVRGNFIRNAPLCCQLLTAFRYIKVLPTAEPETPTKGDTSDIFFN